MIASIALIAVYDAIHSFYLKSNEINMRTLLSMERPIILNYSLPEKIKK